MPYPYTKVLVLGATSGIGRVLAERFIAAGSKVVVVGRRQERLDEFVKNHGSNKASALNFDLNKLDAIPSFAEVVTRDHPDLDCILYNSGTQEKLDFTKPETIDLAAIQQEINLNYVGIIAITKAFLPFFFKQKTDTTLMFTSSGLAMAPNLDTPTYCASKAAMHHFLMAIREQLRSTNVSVVELLPPLVGTELHVRVAGEEGSLKMGIPVDEYADKTIEGIKAGKLEIPVGTSVERYEAIEVPRREYFEKRTGAKALP
ncbi:NAD(P)-binding protein [Microthyrium microscopicum]|uniref:NAD(P)-binding protein n=1 Tax=Microthyrium microscopicum TaxID=703497 RepID=A0A6A6TTY9_9PEZI|nr:NAD(P)-binding protein [Microthyrium microscopicum]